ncbi:MAG: hypothetical protein A3K19_16445 [Lentisphaerae bacterium RIFOXYB12_FULL_65_16]|nr:MAG: hypothetical protein A3K18_32875 [Lentisphaerae bacterium RIFOXYA12_64_32]OGV89033.1 MAG: hypothetical protein A3K19_16445 [Lentisphaerae bacterium RIFOXYB12_FULL_65_16]
MLLSATLPDLSSQCYIPEYALPRYSLTVLTGDADVRLKSRILAHGKDHRTKLDRLRSSAEDDRNASHHGNTRAKQG